MHTKFVEAVHGKFSGNWGKFMVGRFNAEEWQRTSAEPNTEGMRLLAGRGWSWEHVQVLDMETGEGAMFRLGGYAKADLDKHRVWVCPMFEPFLTWLYAFYKQHGDGWWDALPALVELPDAPFAMSGYRRLGLDSGAPPSTVVMQVVALAAEAYAVILDRAKISADERRLMLQSTGNLLKVLHDLLDLQWARCTQEDAGARTTLESAVLFVDHATDALVVAEKQIVLPGPRDPE